MYTHLEYVRVVKEAFASHVTCRPFTDTCPVDYSRVTIFVTLCENLSEKWPGVTKFLLRLAHESNYNQRPHQTIRYTSVKVQHARGCRGKCGWIVKCLGR